MFSCLFRCMCASVTRMGVCQKRKRNPRRKHRKRSPHRLRLVQCLLLSLSTLRGHPTPRPSACHSQSGLPAKWARTRSPAKACLLYAAELFQAHLCVLLGPLWHRAVYRNVPVSLKIPGILLFRPFGFDARTRRSITKRENGATFVHFLPFTPHGGGIG